MPWVYLDDQFPEHPKTAAAGGDAAWLFVCALAYCNRHLTDGKIPKTQVPRLTDRKQPMKLAERLVDVDYFEDRGDHYAIHDYDVWQRASVEQAQRRKEKAQRAARAKWDKQKAAQSNAQADAQAPDQADAEHCLDPCSTDASRGHGPQHPYPPSSSSSEDQLGTPSSDDDDRQLEGLWRDWAQLDLEAREAETGKRVRDRGSWLTTARKRRLAAHGAAARALWDAEPDLSVDDVIRRLEPPKLTVVPDGHQRHRDDWGSTGAEVWDELPDGTVRRRGETA